jgi:hypothetical protein
MEVDVAIVGDFRFPGGTSGAIASEVRALAGAGYRVGLVALATGPLSARRAMHSEIAALAREGRAALVPPGEPVDAGLACLHHPSAFQQLPAEPPLVTARRTILVVHHPPVDAAGVPQYPVRTVARLVAELFGAGILWAPVGPKVRAAFATLPGCPPLTPGDWVNVLDPDSFAEVRDRLPGARPVVGRHSRPERVKWPDDRETFLAAYPEAPDIRVRLMGWGAELDAVVGQRPANWEVLPFGAESVRAFLGSIDYFSYYHGRDWIEAFGRSVLEAMASGRVCFLPPDFEPIFGEGAIYGPPGRVLSGVRRFEAEPALYRDQSERAVAVARERYGPRTAVARVRALVGPPGGRRLPVPRRSGSILYITSNGIGMGHLTRCMATARRLAPGVAPVIVTMSKAFGVVRDEGLAVEYLPFMRSARLEHGAWTAKIEWEVGEILDYHRPNVVVFDGNVPYEGLMQALVGRPKIWRVWQRRPLWRPDVGQDALAAAEQFDLVLEPAELADPVDRGPTKAAQGEVLRVPPIRFLDREEALPRDAARDLLGIGRDRPVILAQLGSGNNWDLDAVLALLVRLTDPAQGNPPADLVVARWRISERDRPLAPHVRDLDAFPIARWLGAFDAAVAVAGYNTFHENLAAGLPTLFLSNDHPEQDEQWLRAEYAALRGLALAARRDDLAGVRMQVTEILRKDVRARLRQAMASLDWPNGAEPAARALEALAVTRKASALAFRPADAAE